MNFHSILKSALLGLLTISFITACDSDPEHTQKQMSQTIDGQAILNNTALTPEEKAEQLVDSAEALFTPESFFFADPIINAALEQDPQNKRAQLYKAWLKPMMKMKGIMNRIQPLLDKDIPEKQRIMGEYNEKVLQPGHIALNNFLMDGAQDITNETQAQDFIAAQIAEYDALRTFLKNNLDMNVVLNISEKWSEKRFDSRGYVCRYTRIQDITYEVECDSKIDYLQVNVDRGDIEALKSIAAGLQVQSILYTAYEAEGVQEYLIHDRNNPLLTDKQLLEKALSTSDKLGKLRANNAIQTLMNLGIDGMIGVRWVRSQQETLCPIPTEGSAFVYDDSKSTYHYSTNREGQFSFERRPGKRNLRRPGHLFDEELCLNNSVPFPNTPMDRLLGTIDLALQGQAVTIRGAEKRIRTNVMTIPRYDEDWNIVGERDYMYSFHQNTGQTVEARFQPANFINSPVQDLRQVMPTEFNDCGEIKSFADNTLGGLFPDGDADSYLSSIKEINKSEGTCGL